ncbi:MAG TPA: hypothetical protein VFE51_22095 [Verrucomicrobiae bacterium]|nr:hypothetical protein [Verrucomicrobiae bacterium]
MSAPAPAPTAIPPAASVGSPEVPFGVNEMRLNGRQWLIALSIIACLTWLTPRFWEKCEEFSTGPDYRIPYDLSKDYWLYARRLRQERDPAKILLLGDSVVWGEYVLPDGTLSHFLNQQAGTADRFINGGLNGLFPLAEEGLVNYYSRELRHRKVLLECNVLWMTSPKADLSTDKEEQFNHSRLIPQFFPKIPCYKAAANERLSAIIENHFDFFAWIGHVQNDYFGQRSILNWTLEEGEGYPPRYPNVYKNPISQITCRVPSAPVDDPQRGPRSPRHRPWSEAGQGPTRFDWVPLESSLQWRGFQSVLKILRERGNDVLVVLGPFNEHMIAEDNRAPYRQLHDGILSRLRQNGIPSIAPEPLPSELYADASHPLTKGYELLARKLYADETFQRWLTR